MSLTYSMEMGTRLKEFCGSVCTVLYIAANTEQFCSTCLFVSRWISVYWPKPKIMFPVIPAIHRFINKQKYWQSLASDLRAKSCSCAVNRRKWTSLNTKRIKTAGKPSSAVHTVWQTDQEHKELHALINSTLTEDNRSCLVQQTLSNPVVISVFNVQSPLPFQKKKQHRLRVKENNFGKDDEKDKTSMVMTNGWNKSTQMKQ